ncbi:MAG: hypothetical protein Ct9H300mP1_33110 [Planctomycetaceae bacterium]|nr:MAG: hypothetical protein Ct9H300mP1_33110 [Planctomycetaceae bacterium]
MATFGVTTVTIGKGGGEMRRSGFSGGVHTDGQYCGGRLWPSANLSIRRSNVFSSKPGEGFWCRWHQATSLLQHRICGFLGRSCCDCLESRAGYRGVDGCAPDGRKIRAKVLGAEPQLDLAVLELNAEALELPAGIWKRIPPMRGRERESWVSATCSAWRPGTKWSRFCMAWLRPKLPWRRGAERLRHPTRARRTSWTP